MKWNKWKLVKHGVPQGSILGPLLFIHSFLIYINDFPFAVKKSGIPILFSDDTSIIISKPTPEKFKNNISSVLNVTITRLHSNLLTQNFSKTHFIQFFLRNHGELKFQIVSNNSIITNINSTKFLGINIDSALSWINHITNLTGKLNKACYAIRAIKPFISQESMKMIYYSYVYSLFSYGIIFWGNAPHNENIFKIQKKNIKSYYCSGRLDSCRGLFKKLHILPLQSQYIFLYFFLLLKIGTILDLILVFMISIHVSIITYICLP
jgi:hypothetical protein